jgi:flagellar assembly protein FliH
MQSTPNSPAATPPDTAPLDETEITRLIAAARAESYRPSQVMPQGKTDAFRPKSLLELARQRREADKQAEVQAEDAPAALDAPEPDAGAEDDALLQAPEPQAPVLDIQDDAMQDMVEDRAADTAAAPALAPADAAPQTDPAELERIRAEAFAAGRAEAEAALHDSLTAATQALQAAAQALAHPAPEALAGLRADIARAVLELASERAGLEIDTMPDAFLERIEALADRIHAQASQPVLRLHPDDLAAIEPLIASSDSLAAMRIVPSVELSRGDVDLAVEGLRLSDRIMGQSAPRKAARAASKPKTDAT